MNPTSEVEGGRVDALPTDEIVELLRELRTNIGPRRPGDKDDAETWDRIGNAIYELQRHVRTSPPADRLGDGLREPTIEDARRLVLNFVQFHPSASEDMLRAMKVCGLVIRTAQRALPVTKE